jgi:hypothetical protein
MIKNYPKGVIYTIVQRDEKSIENGKSYGKTFAEYNIIIIVKYNTILIN